MKKITAVYFLLFCIAVSNYKTSYSFKIDRAILSSNENPMYLDFWPLVAQGWRSFGIKPTLFLIAADYIPVDETVGDVIRIRPIEGVSTASHAQIIRLLGPMYFEGEISIIADIDMLPLNKDYFVNSVVAIPDDKFVVYRDLGYGKNSLRFPMCYNAGKGYLFKEIFNVKSIEDIPETIKKWVAKGCGWETDEVMLYTHVRAWPRFKTHGVFLGHDSMVPQRIDRVAWGYDKQKLKENYYIDAHMVRPLSKYYKEIKELADDVGLNI